MSTFSESIVTAVAHVQGAAAPWRWQRILAASADDREAVTSLMRSEFRLDLIRVGKHVSLEPGETCVVEVEEGKWEAVVALEDGSFQSLVTDANVTRKDALLCYHLTPVKDVTGLSTEVFLPRNGEERRIVRKILLATLAINLMVVVMPLYMNALYDRVLPAKASASLWALSLGVVFAIIGEFLVRGERRKLFSRLADIIHARVEPTVLRQVLGIPASRLTNWGMKQYQALQDWQKLRSCYWLFANSNIIDIPFVILYLLAILILSGWLVLVPIAGLGVYAFIVWRFWRTEAGREDRRFPVMPVISPSEINVARTLARTDLLHDRLMYGSETVLRAEDSRFTRQSSRQTLLTAIISSQTVVIVVAAFYLSINGLMNPAALFAVILLASRLAQPFMSLSMLVGSLQEAVLSYHRFDDLLVKNAAAIQVDGIDQENKIAALSSRIPLWDIHKGNFRYDDDRAILENLTLAIARGEKVALVGNAGSGKSTIMRLLAGTINLDTGSIRFSGLNMPKGQSVVAEKVHYLWQGDTLLADTAYEYLCLDVSRTRQQCEQVLEKLGLIDNRQVGSIDLDRFWNQSGRAPTPEQRQMLAIARLTLTDRNIFLLDEPTEHLNQRHEMLLVNTLKEKLNTESSMVLSTDRFELLKLVDRVIHIERGNIIFDGPRDAFLKRVSS
ncbi:ATP-binding cassette domain-containing protein [Microvirga sp. W0021]|uniref:ATP-binding cassette domain-containing protein n=1 Tax=Hohaiivirga grylli TaxID=3133970 RepID=A0ABV0BL16_9HYPH